MPLNLTDLGLAPNDGNGDPLRVGGQKINSNFTFLDQKIDSLKFPIVVNGLLTVRPGLDRDDVHKLNDVFYGEDTAGNFIIGKITSVPFNIDNESTWKRFIKILNR